MSGSNITKRAFSDALIDLCRHTRFEKISVQDITNRVELNRQTFYYHFTDKQELLAYVYYDRALKILDDHSVTVDNWEEKAKEMLTAIKQNANFFHNTVLANPNILSTNFAKIVHDRFMDLFRIVDTQHQTSLVDQEFYAKFWGYGCSGMLVSWINSDYQESPSEMASMLFKMAKDTEFYGSLLYKKLDK